MPTLTYIQDSVTAVSTTAAQPLNFAKKCNIHSLGIVASREEVVSEGSNAATYLNVTITHNDWDAQLQVKTFSLFAVGRKVHVVGQLVDFDMEANVAVVVVAHVSVTTAIKPTALARSLLEVPLLLLEKLEGYYGPSPANGKTVAATSSAGPFSRAKKAQMTTPLKGKGKAAASIPHESDEIDTESKPEQFDEERKEKVKPKPQGRPRKDVLKDAAKRMKRT
ncbi:hypothetical protein PCASD_18649 [Puccinia coronata f. sp. avenae]|uniref:Uncharacterized protein n=1 Tax=Puccinia coronata f. sp. avenae TaxID=200324 RepID=A0A2N5UF65_9BASI|nr:hypothetical protein PCASD_18649 [Puccinia coronata f. sp. avenae]